MTCDYNVFDFEILEGDCQDPVCRVVVGGVGAFISHLVQYTMLIRRVDLLGNVSDSEDITGSTTHDSSLWDSRIGA